MRFLLIGLLLVLIVHRESLAAEEKSGNSVAVSPTGKSCPGCGGSDCSNATFAFGIPILQLIGGGVAGLIWAAIFIWIYVWVDQGPGNGGGGGGFGKRNDEVQGIPPPQVYDTANYVANFQPLPASNKYVYNKRGRGGKLQTQPQGGATLLGDTMENLTKEIRRSIRSAF